MLCTQEYQITRQDRVERNQFSPLAILFTGYSGAGKSTLANRVEQELFKLNLSTYVLDGDNIRKGINKDLSFSAEDRQENLRRVGEILNLFIDAGVVVLAAFIAPFAKGRDNIKHIVGSENYIEVFVNTSLDSCKRRDKKNLYKLADRGKIKNMTGIDSIYEPPADPDIEITENMSLENSVCAILNVVLLKIKKDIKPTFKNTDVSMNL